MADVTAIILTKNEEKHIARCINSIKETVKNIIIVDAFSSDRTIEIATQLGAQIYRRSWINYANQLNWAIENIPIKTNWVMRIDADEYLTPELAIEIKNKLDELPEDITGVFIKRRIYFMNKWMKHGGCYPQYHLRIWKNGKGRCEDKWMDEHIIIFEGKTIKFKYDLIDQNLNDLTYWIEKHNKYSTREMFDVLSYRYHAQRSCSEAKHLSGHERIRTMMKNKLYSHLPGFIRSFLYFIYRYIFRLGFLDGKEGLIWNFLQACWYRFLVDAKYYEITKLAKQNGLNIIDLITEKQNQFVTRAEFPYQQNLHSFK